MKTDASSSSPNEETPNPSSNGARPVPSPLRIFGTGEMADRIRSLAWAETSLGAIADWPDALVWSINTMLESRFPTVVFWGSEMLTFYNDAYLPLSAEKHPALLGRRAAEAWAEAWHIIGPQFNSVFQSGNAVYQENVLVPVLREGRLTDVYWTYSYSPLRGLDGRVSGILIVCNDVTAALLATEERNAIASNLQAVLESISDGLLMLDKDWRYTYFNEQGARMIGIPRETLIGACVWELFPYAQGTKFYEGYHQAVETGEPIHFEEFYPEPLNKWLECHCYPTAGGLSVYFRDVSERKLAEQRVAENEAKLAAFVDLIPTLAWMANEDGWIFWYNRRWYDYTGTTAEQMEGWGWQSVHDPAMLPKVLERWTRSIQTGEPFEMVFPLRGKDGVFRSFLTRVSPVKDTNGTVTRWFGTNTEIDELERTRSELAAERSRLNAVIEHVPVGLVFSDASGRIQGGNSEVERILRHPIHLSATVEDYREWVSYHPSGEQVQPQEHPLAKTLQDGGVHSHEVLYQRGDGSEGWVTFTSAPIRDAEGGLTGAVVATQDIDAKKRAEEALRKSEKLAVAGRLAATIAHEINNPLEAVTNLLYILRTSTEEEHTREHIALAEEELARVTQIVTHSLRFHRSSVLMTWEKLSTILDSAAAVYKSRLIVDQIYISRRYRDTRSVCCYSSEIRQVFGNLIGNAFDAIRKGGTVHMRVRDASDVLTGVAGVRVTVADTGTGMDAQTLKRIAEPFFTTKGINGTGLGLWISRDILQKHHALLQVRSRQQEERSGTVFSLFLPMQLKE